MKLLYCPTCDHAFSLSSDAERSCHCGNARGRYLTARDAYYLGELTVPLGFANWSFRRALKMHVDSGEGERFEAFVVPVHSSTFVYREEG